jgi:uncharacterized protein with GYD domain
METFLMLGKYSNEGLREIGPDRTKSARQLISELGGKVKSMHALLGGYDVVIIAELPNTKTAMKASMGISLLTGITFNSYPALSVEDFDKIMEK